MRDCTGGAKAAVRAIGLCAAAALLGAACSGSEEESVPRTGPAIYKATCQTCHGRQGEGFVGPSLVDAAARYPDVADEVAIVTNGNGQMPAFGGRLTTAQIATVVDYTRLAFTSVPNTSSTTAPFVGPTIPTTTAP